MLVHEFLYKYNFNRIRYMKIVEELKFSHEKLMKEIKFWKRLSSYFKDRPTSVETEGKQQVTGNIP